MSYCPRWIYDAIFAQASYDFIVSDAPLMLSAKKFVSALSAKYEPLNIEEITEGCEEMIRFLAEVDANEHAADLLRAFAFSGSGMKRKPQNAK